MQPPFTWKTLQALRTCAPRLSSGALKQARAFLQSSFKSKLDCTKREGCCLPSLVMSLLLRLRLAMKVYLNSPGNTPVCLGILPLVTLESCGRIRPQLHRCILTHRQDHKLGTEGG